jgi:hypothetical protein
VNITSFEHFILQKMPAVAIPETIEQEGLGRVLSFPEAIVDV